MLFHSVPLVLFFGVFKAGDGLQEELMAAVFAPLASLWWFPTVYILLISCGALSVRRVACPDEPAAGRALHAADGAIWRLARCAVFDNWRLCFLPDGSDGRDRVRDVLV